MLLHSGQRIAVSADKTGTDQNDERQGEEVEGVDGKDEADASQEVGAAQEGGHKTKAHKGQPPVGGSPPVAQQPVHLLLSRR